MEKNGEAEKVEHVVAMPYPGRGHINPMLNLCTLLLSSNPNLLISLVVTEEWLAFLTAELKRSRPPANLRFVAIPQVIPSEIGRAADFYAFLEATQTKLKEPFENVLESLKPPATAIVYDTFLAWVVGVGNRRGIPVASFFTQSASMFTIFAYYDLLFKHRWLNPDSDQYGSGGGNEKVDFVPGLPSTTFADLPAIFHEEGRRTLPRALDAVSAVNNAQCLLFTSVYELEEQAITSLKTNLPIPIFPIGPMIPYFKLESSNDDQPYFKWLDSQPHDSVLYISQGSFLSVSSAQMDEIVAGIIQSGVKFLWVTRGDCSLFKEGVGEKGYLVPWCDQLKVLCHSSVGGFWTHCGWNSTYEGVYAGVPMLTCPIFWDQLPNSKMIVSDWRIGWRVIDNGDKESLVTRDEIAHIVSKFMDSKGDERKEMVNRVKSVQEICRNSMASGGSAASNLQDFIANISR